MGRKVFGSNGVALKDFTDKLLDDIGDLKNAERKAQIEAYIDKWIELSQSVCKNTPSSPDTLTSSATDYLMYSGYIMLAVMWAKMEDVALGKEDDNFYAMKVNTCEFYFDRLLPRVETHRLAIEAGARATMKLDNEAFLAMASA